MPIHQGRTLPRVSFRQIDLPEISEWEVNSPHYLVVKVEMVGKNNTDGMESPQDHKKLEADFRITNVRALGDEPVDAKSLESEDFERVVARAKSGRS